MPPAPATRLSRLPAYVFAVIGEQLRAMRAEGIDVIQLDIGSPDLPPPPAVVEALHTAAQDPHAHGYAGYRGTPRFRQAVADYYQRRFGVSVSESEVLPLIGSKEGIVNLCLAFLDSGDTVMIPDIGYPSYAQGARLAGADIHWLPLSAENGYLPSFDDIPAEVAQRTKILWLNYPNNPTGAVADLSLYQRAVDFCRQYNILLASDNPYVDVTFDGYVAGSALQAEGALDCTIEFMSLSKSHNMAGWRLGAAVGNPAALRTLLQIKSNVDSGHFIAVYEAGITALEQTSPAWIAERNAVYQRRRDRILAALPEIGLVADKPLGSLYLWAKPLTMTSTEYIEGALQHAHVSLAPGGAYGPGGEDYLRISVGVPDDRLDVALERLKQWYQNAYG